MVKGNEFWKLRTKVGRDKLFSDPATLLDAAYEYFRYCDRSPWMRPELVKYQGDATEYEIPLGRPYSIDGFTIYLGVSGAYFRAAKANINTKIEAKRATPEEVELVETIQLIETICRTQNVEGAAVNVFNPVIIARLHSIAENTNVNQTGEAKVTVTVRDQETADLLTDLDDIL